MMSRLRVGIALATLWAACAQPAIAQRTGTRIGKTATEGDGREVLAAMAACFVESQPGQSRRWLSLPPGSADELKLNTAMRGVFELCLDNDRLVMDNSSVAFKRAQLRSYIAANLVQGAIRARTPKRPDGNPPVPFSDVQALPDGSPAIAGDRLALLDFGQCVALAQWDGAIALLRAAPNTPEENAAVALVVPALGPCLIQGQQLSLKRPLIRAMLAEPMYHLLNPTTRTSAN